MSDEEHDDEIDEAQAGTPRVFGIERWVQFSFVALAIITFYLADRLIDLGWSYFAEPNSTVASAAAAIIGLLTGFICFRHPAVNTMAHEVADELAKSTWPSRKETYSQTVVVIITSVIAAAYLGLFDAAWSAFTDMIYNT